MGNGGTKENQNVYFRARKQAAMYNERLALFCKSRMSRKAI